jgi:phenylalanyl-tRNA synthetase alpha chain
MSSADPDALLEAFRAELAAAHSAASIEALRRTHTGKSSPIKAALKGLRELEPAQREAAGARLNEAMRLIAAELDQAFEAARTREIDERLGREWQDLSMPGVVQTRGGRHPVTIVEEQCMSVLRQLGFELVEGTEVETDYFTFDALNIPKHHPARDMQDTFWLSEELVLRTHTTTVQARVLSQHPPLPIRIASAGRVYRNEAVDATHLAMFHQFEGLWVDRGLTFAHLKGVLSFIARELFGARPLRFKPKFYPYTEPSVGVDIQCGQCDGAGCHACHRVGWITILGAGMVHPKVFSEFGYDPEDVTGIAFGLGTTRMACQWAGVSAPRSLYRFDNRVLRALHRGES